ncbi:MAG: Rieske (2Fe-2S) protein [Gammaproteobacteria bacterium]|nr:Rieske (2Fe-2S) protein [Gammaproteobacteria bacterium]
MSEGIREYNVCALTEIDDPGAKEIVMQDKDETWYGFLVRKGDNVYAYLNSCPHTGAMLNWGPDKFLTRDKSLIMCSVHGAIFEMDSGVCIAGPCKGRGLRSLDVVLKDGRVIVSLDKLR